jgi:hypothetical protein
MALVEMYHIMLIMNYVLPSPKFVDLATDNSLNISDLG